MAKKVILNAQGGMEALKVVADYQDNQRAAAVAKTIEMLNINNVPWPENVLERLSLMNMEQANQVLARHPGHDLHTTWQSIQSVLDIFKLSCDDVQSSLNEFHAKAQEANFFSRRRQEEFERICLHVNKCMYHLSCTSISLYNISQGFRGLFAPEDYTAYYESCYTNSKEHHLIKAIRNALSHKHFAPAKFRVSKVGDIHETEFYVSSKELLEYGDLRQPDKQYVLKAEEHIKVRPIFEQHQKNVVQFYNWVELELGKDERFLDYTRCKLAPKQQATRIWWSIMMQQIEAKGLDPYEHLQNHFTDNELEEINSLPNQSREQLDKMIELYDTDKACNEEFKQRVYKFFRIKE